MLELGAQELFCVADPSHINRLVEQFGGEPFPDDDVIRLANRGLAGEIFARAGSPCASIDCKPYPFGIVMDLNQRFVAGRASRPLRPGDQPRHQRAHRQSVERGQDHSRCHSRGRANASRRAGIWRVEHGLFNYNPKFFWFLAMANGYRTVKMWAWVDDKATEVPASFSRDITYEPSR